MVKLRERDNYIEVDLAKLEPRSKSAKKIEEVSGYIDVPPGVIRKWIIENYIPFNPEHLKYPFDENDIEKWLLDRRVREIEVVGYPTHIERGEPLVTTEGLAYSISSMRMRVEEIDEARKKGLIPFYKFDRKGKDDKPLHPLIRFRPTEVEAARRFK